MGSFALHDKPGVLWRRRRFHKLPNYLTSSGERQVADDLVWTVWERVSEEVTVDYLHTAPELASQTFTEAWVEFDAY
jgi:hypothetical protein